MTAPTSCRTRSPASSYTNATDSTRQRTRSFTRKVDADTWRKNVEADLLRGEYIDPSAGKVTFMDYAEGWCSAQTFDPSTAEAVELRLRLHAYPYLGSRELRQIRPSTIQAWLRGLTSLAPAYQRVIFANVSTALSAAVDDELIRKNPCLAPSVSRPAPRSRKVVPWETRQVHAVRAALPARYELAVMLGAGLGLRQGEIFGLSTADVDFLRCRV